MKRRREMSRKPRIWAAAALFAIGVALPAVGSIARDRTDRRTNRPEELVLAGPQVLPGGSIIASGEAVSLADAERKAPFRLVRPHHRLASDDSLRQAWLSLREPVQVGLEYESGLRVYISPRQVDDPAKFFAQQVAEGVPGATTQVGSATAFLVPPGATPGVPGNGHLVWGDVEVSFVADGDFTKADIEEIARSLG